MLKPLKFVGSSLADLAKFPDGARRQAGFELWQVQSGLTLSDFKPMLGVGTGAYEIRIHARGEWHVIYVARFASGIYVLHAFHKKTQRTRQEDVEIARRRYRQIQGQS